MEPLGSVLEQLRQTNRLRMLQTIEARSKNTVVIGETSNINFCSNDYLGLSENPAAIEAAKKTLDEFGVGASASRLICGSTVHHQQLEQELAELKRRDKALVFPSGYAANLALFTSITGKRDAVIVDRLAHASIIDAVRLSQARLLVFDHNDPENLSAVLKKYRGRFQQIFVATEAVFSMDGDIAPLPDLLSLCTQYDAQLIIDEAHSTGVLGDSGRGIEEYYTSRSSSPVIMGTCSKALGAQGGFICSSRDLIDYMISTARPFIYTTAIAPALCSAISANLSLLNTDTMRPYHDKLNRFKELVTRHSLPVICSDSAIFPLIIGDTAATLDFARRLKNKGILALAIREPTVPKGSARIRFTINAHHTYEEIDYLVATLQALCSEFGL